MENATYRGGVLDSGELSDKCLGSDSNPGDVDDPECYEEVRNCLGVERG